MSTPIQEAHHLVNAKITQYFEKSVIPIKEPRKRTDENTIDETEHVRQKPRDKRLGGQLRSPLKDIGPNIGVPLRPPSGRPIPTGSQIKVWRDEPSTSASVRKDKQTIGSNSLSLGSNLAQNKSSQFQKRTLGSLSPAPLKQLSKPSNKLSAKHTTDGHKYKITSIDQASITDLKRNRQASTHQPTSICKSQGLSRTTKPYSTLSKNTPCTSTPLADKNTCSDPMFSILCTDQLPMASSTSDPLLFHTDSAPNSESTFLQDNDNEDSPQERCPNKSNLRESNENTFFSTDPLNSQKQHYSPPVDAISDQSDVCKNNN